MIKSLWLKKLAVVLLATATMFILAVEAEAAALKLGDRGSEVTLLQERLNRLGYGVGEADGIFGRQTEEAVKALQADKGLETDGIAGGDTWNELRTNSMPVSRNMGGSGSLSKVLLTAKRYLGVPYVWGGSTPEGFDCSGFTQYVFAQNGINLPRTADIQYQVGLPVGRNQLQPGDLVYFTTYAPGASHVGIYLGEDKFINATSSRGIAIDRISSTYWGSRYIGARRVLR